MAKEVSEKYQLDVDPNALVRDISVGLKQKVELLKALIRGVKVLILDEPTAVLTPQETRDLFRQLKVLREHNYGIIFISHKLEEIMELCDSATVLRHGRVTGNIERREMDESKLSKLIVGRDVVSEVERTETDCGETILTVRGATYVDDIGKCLVKDISFGIRAGEIVGIAGVEGNGQNELSEMITGLLPMTEGEITVNGHSTKGMNIRKIRDLGLAHISEDRMTTGLALQANADENLICGVAEQPPFSRRGILRGRAIAENTAEMVRKFDIRGLTQDKPVRSLSGGNMQKIVLAREISRNPKLLIAAQPTRGLDIGAINFVREHLLEQKRRGTAILLVSADLEEFGRTSVGVISAGCKSILDIGRTLEYLETKGVPVVSYRSDRLPAFYSSQSPYSPDYRLDDPADIARIFHLQQEMGLSNGMLVCNPVPRQYEIPQEEINPVIEQAVREAEEKGIHGKDSTPFLLDRVKQITGGRSLDTNIQLVYNNVRLASEIAKALAALSAGEL